MLRALFTSAFLLAFAGLALADDMDVCRDKQSEPKARLDACDKIIAAGQTSGTDLGLAYAVRGQALMKKRVYDKAIVAFSAAHDADPDNAGIIDARGWAYERTGQDDLAMADYNLALQKRANFGAAYNNRGTLHLRKQALQSALDDFSSAIKYAPNMLFGYTNRARVETLTRDFDAALADFAAAEKIDPAAPVIAGNRCMTYTAMGKFDLAIADCTGVIEKLPKSTFALVNRGEAYLGKGSLDLALKDFNAVLALNPNSVRAHAGRGQLFEKRHDLAQARADYRSAAYALTPFDEIELAMSRATARERLAALTPQGPSGTTTIRRIALVIGNGGYKNVHALDNPPRDAKLIAGSLKDLGFQTVTLANDLTRDKFFEVLHAFASEAEKADWAVVYYAGHGFEIGGVNYLVPVDAKLAADKDAETEAVALEQVIAAVGGARKLRLVHAGRLPRQSVRADHAADHCAQAGRQGIFQYRAERRLHGGLRRQARRDRARRRGHRQPVRGRRRPRHQGAACRGAKTVRHRPRRRLDLDQTRPAAFYLRLTARPRGFLLRGEVTLCLLPLREKVARSAG